MPTKIKLNLLLLTPVWVLLAHYLAMLPHEYAHSFMAWALGYKSNPFALHYGGTSWENLLLLWRMNENVNYGFIYDAGHPWLVALIAFVGVGVVNFGLFILSRHWLTKATIKVRPYLYYFLLIFNLMNLGNLYAYAPIRIFAIHGDMVNVAIGLNISPWWIFIIGTYLVAYFIWQFFSQTLISAYIDLGLNDLKARASLLALCVVILFGFFGAAGLISYGVVSYFLAATSILAIPGLMIALWPGREWVVRQTDSR